MPISLALELFDNSETKTSSILSKDNIIFFSAGTCYMQRNLNQVCNYFEYVTIDFLDEFKSHFQMKRETCELFTCEVMPMGTT